MSLDRFLRTLHAWMGAVILPWVVLAGFTGLYMNHPDLMGGFLASSQFDVAGFDQAVGAKSQTALSAREIAVAAVPDETVVLESDDTYLNRDVFVLVAGSTNVAVDKASGYYWLVTRYQRRLYAPDGTYLQRQIRWDRVMDSLHSDGWLGRGLGSWPADIAAAALIVFGLSGLYLFAAPRLRRILGRRAKARSLRI